MAKEKPTQAELFIELAQPNDQDISHWVRVSEFKGQYASLALGNGLSWELGSRSLAKKHRIKTDKSQTPGNAIRICLAGFNENVSFNQSIRKDIREALEKSPVLCWALWGQVRT
ncbi:hypothetical protein HHE02_06610 [Helicobacter heilmannii]|uniref:hypothetical protein n=1 Tax=Helicobacter heilmannii TaxID=35817 RepID=UPI0002F49CD6|nr:hypothetical protein [Helicobacter heilmannii]BDQ27221.1 hypothetical protein ASB1_08970 [Helicobacter heilmannii]CRF47373.1 hypothetical protein HHE02_06610 [Helicobacter heilmannii]CRF49973.1 hypothetical protein HHE03_16620 [Helicobacter heilmannii]CRF50512.1 hypothetical protein HHE06_03450 [Helicobacter heilmannii]